ncbi:MAG: hypothetical protein HKN22_06945 [Bacteroidia bacterium]|nr:hypothetical protein [Bacteroidia bacterium]
MRKLLLLLCILFPLISNAQVSNFAFGGNSGLQYRVNDVNFGMISLSPGFSFDFGEDNYNNSGMFFGVNYSFFEDIQRQHLFFLNPYYQRYLIKKNSWSIFLRVDFSAGFGGVAFPTAGEWSKEQNLTEINVGLMPGIKVWLNEGKSSISIGVDLVNYFRLTVTDPDNVFADSTNDYVEFLINKNPLSLEYMVVLGGKGNSR